MSSFLAILRRAFIAFITGRSLVTTKPMAHINADTTTTTMTSPDVVWGTWLIAVTGSFAVLERRALNAEVPGHTLTAFLKRWLGIRPRRSWRSPGVISFVFAMLWLALHIIVEIAVDEIEHDQAADSA